MSRRQLSTTSKLRRSFTSYLDTLTSQRARQGENGGDAHDQCAHRVLVIDLRHRAKSFAKQSEMTQRKRGARAREPLLAGNVPELQVHACLGVDVDDLEREVDAHGRLVRAREEVVHKALNERRLSRRQVPHDHEFQPILLHAWQRTRLSALEKESESD